MMHVADQLLVRGLGQEVRKHIKPKEAYLESRYATIIFNKREAVEVQVTTIPVHNRTAESIISLQVRYFCKVQDITKDII